MAVSWVKKHEPKSISGFGIQKEAVASLDSFVRGFAKQKKKAALIYGPSGSGKTVAAYTVAEKYNLEVLEVNASDMRNKDGIESSVGAASKQMSLFTKGKIILVDEVEGLSGNKDRGGASALASLIDKSGFPIIITAQNPFDKKLSALRKKSVMIEFAEVSYAESCEVLKRICSKEGVEYEDIALKGLAMRSGGDLRAAINDLQSIAGEKKKLTRESLEFLSERNRQDDMPSALIKVLRNSDPKVALSAFDNVSEDIGKQMLWIDENLPKEYTDPDDLAKAYDFLSLADVFNGRISRWQHWRFLSYVNALMTAGVATSKSSKIKPALKYEETKRILKIWMANMKLQKKKAICQKIADATHTSSSRAGKDSFPFLQEIIRSKSRMAEDIAEELEIESEEIEWMRK